MTNKLEKQFFDTFGIEPKCESRSCDVWGRPVEVKYFTDKKEAAKFGIVVSQLEYPEITDSILLELMELLMKQQATEFYYNDEYLFSSKLLGSSRPTCNKVKNLRELVLRTANCLGGFAPLKDEMLKQVQTIFKEG